MLIRMAWAGDIILDLPDGKSLLAAFHGDADRARIGSVVRSRDVDCGEVEKIKRW